MESKNPALNGVNHHDPQGLMPCFPGAVPEQSAPGHGANGVTHDQAQSQNHRPPSPIGTRSISEREMMQIETWHNHIIGVDCKRFETDDYTVNFMPYHEKGMGPETADGETALIVGEKYYILNGDWMMAYVEFDNLEQCMGFFAMKYPLFGSSWSNLP